MRRILTTASLVAALLLAACGRPDPPEPEHRPEPQAPAETG